MIQRQLFLDKFIEYWSGEYTELPEKLSLIEGLTLAEIDMGDLTGVKGTKVVPNITCEGRNWFATNKGYGPHLFGPDTEIYLKDGLTTYDTIEELVALPVGTQGLVVNKTGKVMLVEVAAEDSVVADLIVPTATLLDDYLDMDKIERTHEVKDWTLSDSFDGVETAAIEVTDTFYFAALFACYVKAIPVPTEIPEAFIGQL